MVSAAEATMSSSSDTSISAAASTVNVLSAACASKINLNFPTERFKLYSALTAFNSRLIENVPSEEKLSSSPSAEAVNAASMPSVSFSAFALPSTVILTP